MRLVTRARLLKLVFLLLLLGAVLRVTGVVEIEGRYFVAGIVLELLLAWIEAAILIALGRPIYRRHRERLQPFDAFVETLREVEPVPPRVFALMERELRMWHQTYRRARGA